MIRLPEPFEKQIQDQLQSEYRQFLAALSTPPPVSIRINPSKQSKFEGKQIPWTSLGYYLPERPSFTLDPTFHAGAYYVQEPSSMFLESAIRKTFDLSKPAKVLDLCAAPGGKSTHLGSLFNNESLIVANEVIKSRANILSENIQKWGHPNCFVSNNDPRDFLELASFFDVIVVDAPCSGEGLFRKDPDAMKEWSTDNVELCSARQRRILNDTWPSLKENGILIYSTCTYNPQENEENLIAFAKEHAVEFIDLNPPAEWNIDTVRKGDVIGYRFYPHRLRGEGFFLSAMRKKEEALTNKFKKSRGLTQPGKSVNERLQEWIINPDRYSIIQHQDLLFAFPKEYMPDLEQLLQKLKVVYAGTNLATLKHDKLIPEHGLAISNIINKQHFPAVDVTEKEALQYLRRETLNVNSDLRGYVLINYQNLPLGWVNALQNRMNNLYPQEWRIRMS